MPCYLSSIIIVMLQVHAGDIVIDGYFYRKAECPQAIEALMDDIPAVGVHILHIHITCTEYRKRDDEDGKHYPEQLQQALEKIIKRVDDVGVAHS